MEAGSRIFKAPKNNRCLLFSLLKREMVYFLSTQDLFQVAEVNRTFPADYANTTQTGPFHVITTRIIKPVCSEEVAPHSKIHGV